MNNQDNLDELIKAHNELMDSDEWVEIPSDSFTVKDPEGLKALEIEDAKDRDRQRLAMEGCNFGF